MIDIARLSPADHGAYLAHLLGLDTAALEARFGAGADQASVQAHALRLAAREGVVLGARRFGRLVGTAELIPTVPGKVASASVAVEREARDAGLGTRLVLAVIETAREAGCREIYFDMRADSPAMARILARVASAAEALPGGRRYVVRVAPAAAEGGSFWHRLAGRAA